MAAPQCKLGSSSIAMSLLTHACALCCCSMGPSSGVAVHMTWAGGAQPRLWSGTVPRGARATAAAFDLCDSRKLLAGPATWACNQGSHSIALTVGSPPGALPREVRARAALDRAYGLGHPATWACYQEAHSTPRTVGSPLVAVPRGVRAPQNCRRAPSHALRTLTVSIISSVVLE